MAPGSIQLADGRIITVVNKIPSGYAVDATKDYITGKVFVSASRRVVSGKLFGVKRDRKIYEIDIETADTSSVWVDYSAESYVGFTGIRSTEDFLFVLSGTLLLKISKATKIVVASVVIHPGSDSPQPFDLNLDNGLILTEFNEQVRVYNYNLKIVYYWSATAPIHQITGTFNTSNIFLGGWCGEKGAIWTYSGTLVASGIVAWEQIFYPSGMLANNSFVYTVNGKYSLTGVPVYLKSFTKVFCFLQDKNVVASAGIYSPTGTLIKSLNLSAFWHISANERYCPTEP